MNALEISKILNLSKQAKKSKNYELERDYLNQAIALAPTNTKVINALIRNLRKGNDKSELKKWLETLYKLSPNGKILFELMQLEQSEGNFEKVREILIENVRIEPNSKKLKKRLQRAIERDANTLNTISLFTLTEIDAELIKNAREIVYSDADFSDKYNQVVVLLAGQPDEITLCILAELYINESFRDLAINFVKRYKKGLNPDVDIRKMKLVNKLLELVLNKKTVKFNWNDFWKNHTTILFDEKPSSKILVKNNKKE